MRIRLLFMASLLLAMQGQAYAKDDIKGFKLGMSANSVVEKISKSQYRCTPIKYPGPSSDLSYKSVPLEVFCRGGDEELKLGFSNFLDGKPLLQIQRTFPSPLSGQEMIERVQSDYALEDGKRWTNAMEWSDGPHYIRLGILPLQRYELRLTSTELIQKDKDAGAARQGR